MAEPRPCAMIGRIPVTLCFRLHLPPVKRRPVGSGGPQSAAPEGASRPLLLALSRQGHWGSCSRFLNHANRALLPCPHTAQMVGREVVIPSQPQVLLTIVPLASPAVSV